MCLKTLAEHTLCDKEFPGARACESGSPRDGFRSFKPATSVDSNSQHCTGACGGALHGQLATGGRKHASAKKYLSLNADPSVRPSNLFFHLSVPLRRPAGATVQFVVVNEPYLAGTGEFFFPSA